MAKKKKEVHQPDDNLFREVMKKKESARAYLSSFYPEFAKNLDLDSLERQDSDFLSEKYKIFKADIVYRCKFKDSEEHLCISLIWEHKSTKEKHVAIQIGLYMFLAMDKMIRKKDRKLEPVIPLLFYNGKEEWEPKDIDQLFEKHPFRAVIAPYLPNFSFLFKNITEEPIENIVAIQGQFLKAAMLSMASRHDINLVLKYFNYIFELEEPTKTLIVTYIFGVIERTPEEVVQMIDHNDFIEHKNKIMSTLEMLLERGMKKGMEKVMEEKRRAEEEAKQKLHDLIRNMLNGNKLNISDIAEYAQTTEEEVLEIKNSMT